MKLYEAVAEILSEHKSDCIGLCSHLLSKIGYDEYVYTRSTLEDAFMAWPKFSGCLNNPIPGG